MDTCTKHSDTGCLLICNDKLKSNETQQFKQTRKLHTIYSIPRLRQGLQEIA